MCGKELQGLIHLHNANEITDYLEEVLVGREPEGSVGTKLVNKAHGDF